MANPNPLDEIKWKPGQSGNPNGRPPKGYSITDTVREMMANSPEAKEKLSKKVLEKALEGDLKAVELLWAYMDGKPTQTSNINLQENPEEKVKRTLDLLKKDELLSSGNSDILQNENGETLPSN